MLLSLLKHTHSVQLLGFGVHRNAHHVAIPYLVMEFLVGGTLSKRLRSCWKLSPHEAVAILVQALKGLAEAHTQGIVHRDIKPCNIFLCAQTQGLPTVKLLDYGIASPLPSHWNAKMSIQMTLPGVIIGTPAYMPPEQSRGKQITAATDVYALGCVGFRMLAGRRPYKGQNAAQMAIAHAVCPTPDLPPRFRNTPVQAVLRKAMAKEPKQRYPDASAMLKALTSIDLGALNRQPPVRVQPDNPLLRTNNPRYIHKPTPYTSNGLLTHTMVFKGI